MYRGDFWYNDEFLKNWSFSWTDSFIVIRVELFDFEDFGDVILLKEVFDEGFFLFRNDFVFVEENFSIFGLCK
jgi:hypothetical protein